MMLVASLTDQNRDTERAPIDAAKRVSERPMFESASRSLVNKWYRIATTPAPPDDRRAYVTKPTGNTVAHGVRAVVGGNHRSGRGVDQVRGLLLETPKQLEVFFSRRPLLIPFLGPRLLVRRQLRF
jgi:hypothetical protein